MPNILLLSRDEERVSGWASALDRDFQVWAGLANLPEQIRLDVIVTDYPASEPVPAHAHVIAPGDIGVVAVRSERDCDVSLPADCLPRELHLACTLLAEVVSLRRQRRTADRANQTLRTLALCDPLTGLPNRRAWEEDLARRFGESRSSGRLLCLALIDLDRLKEINDQHGYLRGDEAIKAAGQALGTRVRKDDFAARLGGDELGLLLWDLPPAAAGEVVERVRAALGVQLNTTPILSLSASAGYAVLQPGESNVEGMFSRADSALRRAKEAGRNCTRGS